MLFIIFPEQFFARMLKCSGHNIEGNGEIFRMRGTLTVYRSTSPGYAAYAKSYTTNISDERPVVFSAASALLVFLRISGDGVISC